jgi:hypothetical protein
MIRLALACAAALALSACAGSATFSVRPFREPTSGQMECCEFSAMDWRDIGSLNIDATKSADGSIVVHYQATAIGATAPLTAQGATVSSVATAVSNAAAAAIKVTP